MKQRSKLIRGIDRVKKNASDKFDKEQLKTVEEQLAQYVISRPIELCAT